MARAMAGNDLDYLAARLHGRRSRLAEMERLDALCRLRVVPQLARALYPGAEFGTSSELQRRLTQDLVAELAALQSHLSGAGACLLDWLLVRFQVENLKVLIRGIATGTPVPIIQDYLIPLPGNLELNIRTLAPAASLVDLTTLFPEGPLREGMKKMTKLYRDHLQPFFLEAALDRCYLTELLARTGNINSHERELIRPICLQEADIFHLSLAERGRYLYGLAPELLLPLHIPGTRLPRARFAAMITDPDLSTAAARAAGRVFDTLPATITPGTLEALAWKRFLFLSNRAFRLSHTGLGVVVGYTGLRRMEVANLITLSEGLRMGLPGETIRPRLIPRTDREMANV